MPALPQWQPTHGGMLRYRDVAMGTSPRWSVLEHPGNASHSGLDPDARALMRLAYRRRFETGELRFRTRFYRAQLTPEAKRMRDAVYAKVQGAQGRGGLETISEETG